jgi:uncharacterized protein
MLNLLLSLAGAYALICIGARVLHRYFIYMPDRTRYAPKDTGLNGGVQEIAFKAADGVTLIAWYRPARESKPTLLYFTGNGGNAASRAKKIAGIGADGYGVFILNYRRYGGSGGWPSEVNNVADAVAAYERLRALGLDAQDIVAYGESLGTAVATRLSLQRPVKAVVLEAPFTSVVDVGKQVWWFLPLGLIMVDQYRSIDIVGQVRVPLLIVHGARDSMIPRWPGAPPLRPGQRAEETRHSAQGRSQRPLRSWRVGEDPHVSGWTERNKRSGQAVSSC